MQVNSIRNLSFSSSLMAHKAVDKPQPEAPQPEKKPEGDQGVTASLYFTGKKDGHSMRNATMAGLGSLVILASAPSLQSCSTDESYAYAESDSHAHATATAYVSTHGKGCTCPECCKHRDTVYVYVPGEKETIYVEKPVHDTTVIEKPGKNDTIIKTDTVKIPVVVPKYDTVYVDTGSYHVKHDTIEKWKYDFQKPIPLDTLSKIMDRFDIPTQDPSRKNIVNYQGIREWEYGDKFEANINLLESSKNILVYDREDKDYKDNHTGWGKDVYRIPTSSFKIETYDGKVLNSPKGMFYEVYTNPWNQKTSVYDNNLVQRYFLQTIGDHVRVFSYDPSTGLYREDGKVSEGYLNRKESGNNILLTDLIASDPSLRWNNTDPAHSTEDHLVGVNLTGVNNEELKLMYARQRDDEFAEQHYGIAK